MSRLPLLQDGERILWRGRPAPRCYTFRFWRLNGAGVLLLGAGLASNSFWPTCIGLPLVLAGLLLTVGLPVFLRLRWGRIFYTLTDRRLLLQGGLLRDRFTSRLLADLIDFTVERHGTHLATVRLCFAADRRLLPLFCLEHPETLTNLLKPQLGSAEEKG